MSTGCRKQKIRQAEAKQTNKKKQTKNNMKYKQAKTTITQKEKQAKQLTIYEILKLICMCKWSIDLFTFSI